MVDVFAATDISTPLVRTSGLVPFDLTREIIIYIYISQADEEGKKKLNIIMKVNKKCEHAGEILQKNMEKGINETKRY